MEPEIILCDTSVIIDWFNGNAGVETLFKRVEEYYFFVSVITKAEVQQGAENKLHLRKINRALEKFPAVEAEFKSSQIFSELFEKYFLSHHCSIPDMLIASIAIYYAIELFTFNEKDFKFIKGLKLFPHKIQPLKKSGWFL
jgi:predicted nucleic acid-binding protein